MRRRELAPAPAHTSRAERAQGREQRREQAEVVPNPNPIPNPQLPPPPPLIPRPFIIQLDNPENMDWNMNFRKTDPTKRTKENTQTTFGHYRKSSPPLPGRRAKQNVGMALSLTNW